MDDVDNTEPGSQTSEQTMVELEEVALRRAAALGRPVVVAAFASSGKATVFDLDVPDGAPMIEGELVEAGLVPVWPSRPPRPPA
jgi:hypothetical protein